VKHCSQKVAKTNQIRWTPCRYLQFRVTSILLFFLRPAQSLGRGRGGGGGTKSRVHVSAVVSLRSPRFLTCNSLSLDVHQFFPRLHFNRLCFPERRLVIENTNLLLQTSVSVCVCCFHFGEKIDITLTRSKGCVFHMASLYRCVCVCVRQEREV